MSVSTTFKVAITLRFLPMWSPINALARVSRCLEHDRKMCILQAFVLSFNSYCPVVWYFVGMEDNKNMEKVQYTVLKFIFNYFKSPYGILREQSSLPLLYIQYNRVLLIEIHKMYIKCVQNVF